MFNSEQITHSHIKRLDVLRGVAILGVFLFHYNNLVWQGSQLTSDGNSAIEFIVSYLTQFGANGVALFFVISGFVIHLSFLKTKFFNIKTFYWRRFWRIYPPYLLALICFIVIKRDTIFDSKNGILQVVSHILLLHNLTEATFFGINPSFWSLALEMQFYLLYPILLVIYKQIGIQATLILTLFLSLSSYIVAAVLTDWQQPLLYYIWTFPTFTWFDWTIGVYVAECFYYGYPAFSLSRMSIFGIIIVFLLLPIFKPLSLLSYQLTALISAILIDLYIRKEEQLSRFELWLVPLGVCSYSFYLWHQPLMPLLLHFWHRFGIKSSLIDLPLVLLIIGVWSWLLYLTIEKWSIAIAKNNITTDRMGYVGNK